MGELLRFRMPQSTRASASEALPVVEGYPDPVYVNQDSPTNEPLCDHWLRARVKFGEQWALETITGSVTDVLVKHDVVRVEPYQYYVLERDLGDGRGIVMLLPRISLQRSAIPIFARGKRIDRARCASLLVKQVHHALPP